MDVHLEQSQGFRVDPRARSAMVAALRAARELRGALRDLVISDESCAACSFGEAVRKGLNGSN